MVNFFPVPRNELPAVHVTTDEHHGRRSQMDRMLESLVDEYEHYTDNGRQVDSRRWKASATRDRLKLFKERTASGECELESTYPANCEMRRTMCAGANNASMSFSEESADFMRMTLMVGECPGRMENAMYAVVAANQHELTMVDIFLHEDVADCAILHTMETPTSTDPYHFLGYKWFVRKSPTTSHLVKHRDSVYVESSGLTKTRSGDLLGYHIMHSVDLVGFPEMPQRNCLRSSQSIRALYRQRPGNLVEVFIMGNVKLSGMLKGPLASVLAQETLFNMPKLVECGETKRLADMIRDLRPERNELVGSKRHVGESCGLCRHPRRRFSSAMGECGVCGVDVCSKCRLTKRVFQREGPVLGSFNKIVCCKTCALVAINAKTHGRDLQATIAPVASVSQPPPRPAHPKPSSRPSIRTLAEQLEIRHRSASKAVTSSASSTNPKGSSASVATSLPVEIPRSMGLLEDENRTFALPPAPAFVHSRSAGSDGGDSTSSTPTTDRSRTVSIGSAASSYHTPLTSPSIELVPLRLAGKGLSMAPTLPQPSAPTPIAPQTQPQADLFLKMLELQQKALDAYNTTQQNQQYMNGSA